MVKEKVFFNREISKRRTRSKINGLLRTLFLGSLLFLPACANNSKQDRTIIDGTPVSTPLSPEAYTDLLNSNVEATATAMNQTEKNSLLERIPRSVSEATGLMRIINNDGSVIRSTVTLLDIDDDGVIYLLTSLHSIKDKSGIIQKPLSFEIRQTHEGHSEEDIIIVNALEREITYAYLQDHVVIAYLPYIEHRSTVLDEFNRKMTSLGLDQAKTELTLGDLAGPLYGIGYPLILNGEPFPFVVNSSLSNEADLVSGRLTLDNVSAAQGASGALMVNGDEVPVGILIGAGENNVILELTPGLVLLVKTAKGALPK